MISITGEFRYLNHLRPAKSHLTKRNIIMYNYTNICIYNILIKIWYNRGEKWGKKIKNSKSY